METRNKRWRRRQMYRKFNRRMRLYAAFRMVYPEMHWFELAKTHWAQVYKTTGNPCSCPLCSGNKYDRLACKAITRSILKEAEL